MEEYRQSKEADEESKTVVQKEPKQITDKNEVNVLIDLKKDTKNQSIDQLRNMLLKEIQGDGSALTSIPEF